MKEAATAPARGRLKIGSLASVHLVVLATLMWTDEATFAWVTSTMQWLRGFRDPLTKLLSTSATWNVFGSMGEAVTVLLVGWAIWKLDTKRRRLLIVLLAGSIAAGATAGVMSPLVARERPNRSGGLTRIVPLEEHLRNPRTMSFPSGHATAAAALATFIALAYPSLRPLAIVAAMGCAISRVRFHKHFPSDVYAGMLIGHYTMLWIWSKLSPKLLREEEALDLEGAESAREWSEDVCEEMESSAAR